MSVVNITERYSGMTAGGDRQVQVAEKVFDLLMDSAADGPFFNFPLTCPVSGTVIPKVGTGWPDMVIFRSLRPQVRRISPYLWEVRVPYQTADYTSVAMGNAPPVEYDDPLAAPADIAWGDSTRQMSYFVDLDDKPVVNTLGELIDPLPMREVSDHVLIIERNQASFDPADKAAYQDTIGGAAFWDYAQGLARMVRITANSVTASTPYYRVRYEIHFRVNTPDGVAAADAWKKQVLNQGRNYKPTVGATQTEPTPNGEQKLLKEDGTLAEVASPHWLFYREYRQADWSALGLEAS